MTGPRPAAQTVTKAREPHVHKPCTLIDDCPSPRSIRVASFHRVQRKPSPCARPVDQSSESPGPGPVPPPIRAVATCRFSPPTTPHACRGTAARLPGREVPLRRLARWPPNLTGPLARNDSEVWYPDRARPGGPRPTQPRAAGDQESAPLPPSRHASVRSGPTDPQPPRAQC
jgi:hypothetical protein